MIFLLTWLLLHTIHNLEAPSAVFDPGGDFVSRYSGPSPSEPEAETVMDALGCFEQAVRETAQEALSAIFSTEATNILALNILALRLEDKALKGGVLM